LYDNWLAPLCLIGWVVAVFVAVWRNDPSPSPATPAPDRLHIHAVAHLAPSARMEINDFNLGDLESPGEYAATHTHAIAKEGK
jgi:hypothetical protein